MDNYLCLTRVIYDYLIGRSRGWIFPSVILNQFKWRLIFKRIFLHFTYLNECSNILLNIYDMRRGRCCAWNRLGSTECTLWCGDNGLYETRREPHHIILFPSQVKRMFDWFGLCQNLKRGSFWYIYIYEAFW